MSLVSTLSFRTISKKVTNLTLMASLIFSINNSVLAQPVAHKSEGDVDQEATSSWGVGVAAISNQPSIKGIARDNIFFPFVTYENEYIHWFGPNLDAKLLQLYLTEKHQLEFTFSVGYDFTGYDDDDIEDTPILRGMEEREGGFQAGIQMLWKNPWVDVSTKWMSDISGDRDGYSVSVNLEKTWMFGQHLMLAPRLGVIWHDDSYIDFHYGVRSEEARNDRPMYQGKSTMNVEYGLRAIYLFNQHNSVFFDVSVTSLGSEIKHSPLIDSSTENNIMLFYIYKF